MERERRRDAAIEIDEEREREREGGREGGRTGEKGEVKGTERPGFADSGVLFAQ